MTTLEDLMKLNQKGLVELRTAGDKEITNVVTYRGGDSAEWGATGTALKVTNIFVSSILQWMNGFDDLDAARSEVVLILSIALSRFLSMDAKAADKMNTIFTDRIVSIAKALKAGDEVTLLAIFEELGLKPKQDSEDTNGKS